jgi:hypothetical protein
MTCFYRFIVGIFFILFIPAQIFAVPPNDNLIEETTSSINSFWIFDWEKRAFLAYKRERTSVALWALNNFESILLNQIKIENDSERKNSLQRDLVITITRIAITHRNNNDFKSYKEHISRGLKLAEEVYGDKIKDEMTLIDFILRLDYIYIGLNKLENINNQTFNRTW